MTGLFKKRLAMAAIGAVALCGTAIAMQHDPQPAMRADIPGKAYLLKAPQGRAVFHTRHYGDQILLEISAILASETQEDALRTRVAMVDGQLFNLVLRHDDLSEGAPATRFTFVRSGNAIIAEAHGPSRPSTTFAGIGWPFD